MEAEFDRWNSKKKHLNSEQKEQLFREGEVWWCNIGMNIGFEIYGKGENFWRPVLILKKHNRFTFFGLPFASTVKPNPYYYSYPLRGRTGCIRMDQGRVFSSKRLSNRMAKLPDQQFAKIKAEYKALI